MKRLDSSVSDGNSMDSPDELSTFPNGETVDATRCQRPRWPDSAVSRVSISLARLPQ